jgi:hypothetical protein
LQDHDGIFPRGGANFVAVFCRTTVEIGRCGVRARAPVSEKPVAQSKVRGPAGQRGATPLFADAQYIVIEGNPSRICRRAFGGGVKLSYV